MRLVQVSQLQPGGPADAGGVRVGDVIDAVDGQAMLGKSQVRTILSWVFVRFRRRRMLLFPSWKDSVVEGFRRGRIFSVQDPLTCCAIRCPPGGFAGSDAGPAVVACLPIRSPQRIPPARIHSEALYSPAWEGSAAAGTIVHPALGSLDLSI
jgi:hypothetical protein